jgi:hypothetical protein
LFHSYITISISKQNLIMKQDFEQWGSAIKGWPIFRKMYEHWGMLDSTVELVNEFKVGDLICSKYNYDKGLILIFPADKNDVENHSGNGTYYYKITKPIKT